MPKKKQIKKLKEGNYNKSLKEKEFPKPFLMN